LLGKEYHAGKSTEGFITFLVLSPFSWMKLWKLFSDAMRIRGSCLQAQRHLGPRRCQGVM
jgi:hypothetical protein